MASSDGSVSRSTWLRLYWAGRRATSKSRFRGEGQAAYDARLTCDRINSLFTRWWRKAVPPEIRDSIGASARGKMGDAVERHRRACQRSAK